MPEPPETASTARKGEVLQAFSRALQRENHVLQESPDLLWQQLYNRLQWEGDECKHLLASELDIRNARGAKPWFHSFSPPREHDAFQFALVGHETQVNTAEFSPDGRLLPWPPTTHLRIDRVADPGRACTRPTISALPGPRPSWPCRR